MLWEGQEVASYLRKVHTVTSQWLNICRTGLDIFEEMLTLDVAMAEDEATLANARAEYSRGITKLRSSSRRRRRR